MTLAGAVTARVWATRNATPLWWARSTRCLGCRCIQREECEHLAGRPLLREQPGECNTTHRNYMASGRFSRCAISSCTAQYAGTGGETADAAAEPNMPATNRQAGPAYRNPLRRCQRLCKLDRHTALLARTSAYVAFARVYDPVTPTARKVISKHLYDRDQPARFHAPCPVSDDCTAILAVVTAAGTQSPARRRAASQDRTADCRRVAIAACATSCSPNSARRHGIGPIRCVGLRGLVLSGARASNERARHGGPMGRTDHLRTYSACQWWD